MFIIPLLDLEVAGSVELASEERLKLLRDILLRPEKTRTMDE